MSGWRRLVLLAALAACTKSTEAPDAGPSEDSGSCGGGYLNSHDPSACPLECATAVQPIASAGASHIPFCTPYSYQHNPPASGPHWPRPAPWGVHQDVVPREWWIHNLEHGGIVLLYNCPGGDAGTFAGCDGSTPPAPNGCSQEIAELEQLVTQSSTVCYFPAPVETKILVTGDPELPKRFGAVAWEWSYLSDTLDVQALRCFISARCLRGPESAP
jgi:hypothetical protein